MAATDWDFSLTRTEIIESALRKVGAYYPGDSISGEEMVNAANALNEMVKEWQSKDIFLWQLKVLPEIDLVAGDSTYSPGSDPAIVGIDEAFIVDGPEHERIEVISWRDYQNIPDKTEVGDPRKVTLDNPSSGTIYTWPVPPTGTSKKLRILGVSKLKDWDTSSSVGDFPSNWLLALIYGLAAILCDDYGISLADRRFLKDEAEKYFKRAKGSNRRGSDRVVVRGAFDA